MRIVNLINKLNENNNDLESFANNVIDELYETIAKQSNFILVHPTTLKELNAKHFKSHTYIIPYELCGKCECILIKENFLKKELYKYYLQFKERCLKGERD